MSLTGLIAERQAKIAQRWLDKTLETYPQDASSFLARQKNQFANPVGHTLSGSLQAIVPLLCEGAELQALRDKLEPVIRIRAVQEFSPAQALSFIYLLKAAIREELHAELADAELRRALWHFEARIDRLALLGFEIYVQCREREAELRIDEMRRSVGLLWRKSFGDSDPPISGQSED